MSRGRGAAAALIALALATTRPTHAEEGREPEPGLDLTWNAPRECPDRAHVLAEVTDLVGERAIREHPLAARGVIARTGAPPRYALELSVGSEAKPRTMSGTDCARIASAAALILALDIDPNALSRDHATEAEVGATPPVEGVEAPRPPQEQPTPRPKETRPKETRPKAPSSTRIRPALEVTVGPRMLVDAGSLPRTTLAGAAVIALARGPLALELQGAVYKEQFTRHGPHDGAGGAWVDLATVGAHGCARRFLPAAELWGCLGGELGREGTTGVNIAIPASAASVWGAVSALVRARVWPNAGISPTMGLEVGLPVVTSTVSIEGYRDVFAPAKVFVQVFFGLEGRIF